MNTETTHQQIQRGRPRGQVQPSIRAANVVPPAQYNRMAAPVLNEPLAAPARAGALDHQNIESRGFRC